MLDAPYGEPEHLIDFTHPLSVAAREVIVHGYKVNTTPGKRVQIDRTSCNESFPFTGRHFSDFTFVQDDPTYELHIKMDHVPDDRLVTDKDSTTTETPCHVFHQG